ncbi:hypothetical protein JQW73_22265 [Sulfitobacter pseudonitzschiae]|nr:hypothetical protein [Pseudosulfitobacter pseudonitzschiae]MBM1888183.1 hypothetical protein [Pseudosulfitobacter pseudonitzschiae]MBM2033464.1 hypothetical protein [Pseudosulfitobacter pseudonitzschiae]MBM2183346.1 hypothetical protein [Pseudosulfitobacter pseudonitzschiae]MBM2188194.1 hypothetical protein [Pseudosulfitobacter pseudonitzschiae]
MGKPPAAKVAGGFSVLAVVMEIVLGALMDWLDRRLARRALLKWVLLAVVFGVGCWLAYLEWSV